MKTYGRAPGPGDGSCSHLVQMYLLPLGPSVGFVQIQPGYEPDWPLTQPPSLVRAILDEGKVGEAKGRAERERGKLRF